MIKLPEKAGEVYNTAKQGHAIPILIEVARLLLLAASVLLSFESGASSLALNKEADLGDWSIWPTEVGVMMFNIFSLMEVINRAADTASLHHHYTPEQREKISAVGNAVNFYSEQTDEVKNNLPELAELVSNLTLNAL